MSVSLPTAIALFRLGRRIRRAVRKARRGKEFLETEEMEEMNWGALRSKTVWFGILQLLFSAGSAIAAGGASEEAVITLITGVATIVLRAVTDKPLSAK